MKKKSQKDNFEKDVPIQAREMMNFTDEPVIGITLMTAEKDSRGNPLDPNIFYWVGKHKPSGMVAIFPSERNQKNEFLDDDLERKGQLN